MKLVRKWLAIFMVIALTAVPLFGCTNTPTATTKVTEIAATTAEETATTAVDNATTAATTAAGKTFTIGYTVYWMSEFTTLMSDAMQEKCDAEGINLIILDAKWDAATQLGHIDTFISQKVDAIIVAAADVGSMVQGVEAANAAGIPIVGVNMRIPTDTIDAYAGPDDVKAGEMMVQYAIDQLGPTFNCIVLEGAEGYSATEDRRTGVKNMLDANPGITALAIKTANWTREGALALMENYIQEYGDKIQAVICHNDEEALGAIQALEAAGMKDKVIVTGIDAIKDACQAIKDGRMEYTVFQDASLEGSLAINYAIDILNGKTISQKETYIEMKGVTKDNVDEYLANFK